MHFSLAFSYIVILVTLVHRNNINGLISGVSRFATHSISENIECRVSEY